MVALRDQKVLGGRACLEQDDTSGLYKTYIVTPVGIRHEETTQRLSNAQGRFGSLCARYNVE